MFSLYGNLFKYRESELRSPREDYLSECLADFFNRLPLPLQTTFASRIFVPEELRAAFAAVIAEVASLRLETQRQIASGRVDLVLLADDSPIVAIENKIAAQLQDDQLASYGRWVYSAARPRRLAIICLLSHLTPPSPGFMRGGDASGKAIPSLHPVGFRAMRPFRQQIRCSSVLEQIVSEAFRPFEPQRARRRSRGHTQR
jgi:hypothetical protein